MNPGSHFFVDLGLLFGAALLGGTLAQLLRQPLILGYLLGGILIGPFTPGPTLSDPGSFQLFAEIGVVLLMFSIGLEFSLGELLRVRRVALIGAPLGMALITGLTVGAAQLLGWKLQQALVVGAAVSVASTMVISKFLIERGELDSAHGRVIVGISLAEDLAVVVLTVIVQAMGSGGQASPAVIGKAFGQALLVLVPLLWLARKAVPGLLARVARTGNMELFLLVAMAVSVGTAALTASLGLSLALGAFLAGLVISESEFAHETLARVLPIRDVFVAVFFVSMGTLIPPAAVYHEMGTVALLVLVVAVGSPLVWTAVIRGCGYGMRTSVLSALGLSQIGEFSYVLMGVGRASGLVGEAAFHAVLATSVVTILTSSLMFRTPPAWLMRRLRKRQVSEVPPVEGTAPRNHVVICGFGRVGREVADALERFRIPYAVVDVDPEVTANVRRRGGAGVFGEAGHEPVLEVAGVRLARLVVVAIPSFESAAKCVRTVRRLRPDVPILARVHQGRFHALMAVAGATTVVQPEIEAGLAMVLHSLDALGVDSEVGHQYVEQVRATHSIAMREGTSVQTVTAREIEVPAASAPEDGLTIRTLHARTGATIASVQHAEGGADVDPSPDSALLPGDHLLAIGTDEQLKALDTLCAEQASQTE